MNGYPKTALAIDGGTPVRTTLLPYGRQQISEDDIAAVVEVLRSDWLTTGPHVSEFEAAFADRVGAQHAVAMSSGTAALHAAVFAAGIGPGDEVIVPALTFAASANCVRYQGGTVVFADVCSDSLCVDPARVAAAITPRTRAIITVDYAGQPSDLEELSVLARQHGLLLIEDACHALGATYRGERIGGLADLTVFSLHPVKHITSGEGGVVAVADSALAAKLREFRNHGITSEARQRESAESWFYEMVDLGYNYRLTDFQCALALNQLQKLEKWVARRRQLANWYMGKLAGMPELELTAVNPDRESAWHLFVVRLIQDRLRVDRAQVFRALRAENIGVNVHYIPVPWHPYYQALGYRKGAWPVTENAYARLLTLPLFPAMTDDDASDVIAALRKVLGAYRK